MRYIICVAALALYTTNSVAFPSRMFDMSMNEEERRALAEISASIEASAKESRAIKRAPGFSASQQYVSATGEHVFQAPSASDLRGPCPGLNAMANHGYIPHNGVATISQFIQGTYDGTHASVRKACQLLTHSRYSLWHGTRSQRYPSYLWSYPRWRSNLLVHRGTTISRSTELHWPSRDSPRNIWIS